MKISPRVRSQAGFTMTELIIVMLIVAILAGIGIPSFKYVTTSNRIATEINALLADMRYARTEAIKEGLPVTVCATTDYATCSTSSPWQSGWMIFSDPTGTQTLATGTLPLRMQAAFSTAYSNSTDTFVPSDASFHAETFNRQGFGSAITTSTVPVAVTIALHSTPTNANWTRCLAISSTGVLTIEPSGATATGTPQCT